jgi:mRNA interferase MazF
MANGTTRSIQATNASCKCYFVTLPYGDARAIKLEDAGFAASSLRVTSHARPGKLFTASRDLILAQVGKLKSEPFRQIIDSAVTLLSSGGSQ